ncbi:MAG: hypothetical protein A2805_03660 [Candidatus Andersenbacteria bacterium RIFCSPHIGHO2_01_FULL_46_36]|uniref:Uncharacterized protein n=1 Tax=Candidatus Andersenbacteria bacterium RIFCSPHIGHO2_12_FULL_45_11 TaxID=1797281 RepID=A0A1G1X2M7_9BACT|nr:MAG: hypothetical protein A2805_03660 [Candidatus Andersenbacteria bacterium RIFCSPHIGHO2_01_FULL_46_36]OGY34223.1 MAG: hypothetical protein A3D99_01925 [Candidatus Andersenbacteria bacterium RIFCSPHIGHO2_12_FULL_45_11]
MSERFERAPQPMQQEPESENSEHPAAPETELSPEVLEKVMEKVRDIDKPGIGYHELQGKKENLESIFRDGLLGTDFLVEDRVGRKSVKEQGREDWKKNAREHNAVVFFNITGTVESSRSKDLEIAQSYYVEPSFKNSTVILFDIGKFKENETTLKRFSTGDRPRVIPESKTYQRDSYNKDFGVDTEYGFILHYRVAPRFFEGVAIKLSRPLNEREIQEGIWKGKTEFNLRNNAGAEDRDQRKLLQEAERIATLMQKVNKDKGRSLVPIYDVHGNLLWPKQMSYEEVKKYVAERATDKPLASSADTPHPRPLPVEGEGDKM